MKQGIQGFSGYHVDDIARDVDNWFNRNPSCHITAIAATSDNTLSHTVWVAWAERESTMCDTLVGVGVEAWS